MKNETNEPAFPVRGGITDNQCNGMTLRDYFAAKALQGALTQQNFADGFDYKEKANWVYQMADAMLEARK